MLLFGSLNTALLNPLGRWSPTFWHQGLVLWKTIFPEAGVGKMVWGSFKGNYVYFAAADLMGASGSNVSDAEQL